MKYVLSIAQSIWIYFYWFADIRKHIQKYNFDYVIRYRRYTGQGENVIYFEFDILINNKMNITNYIMKMSEKHQNAVYMRVKSLQQ